MDIDEQPLYFDDEDDCINANGVLHGLVHKRINQHYKQDNSHLSAWMKA